jgi:hypothetical protein
MDRQVSDVADAVGYGHHVGPGTTNALAFYSAAKLPSAQYAEPWSNSTQLCELYILFIELRFDTFVCYIDYNPI